jgi:hypothetical protein
MKASYLKQEQPIKITVEGGFREDNKLEITISPDSTIDDWIDIFKTILVHQTFTFDIVKELFEPDYEKDNIPTSQSVWKEEF